MSAIPQDFVRKTAQLSEEVTRPFPNSRKVHVTGSRPDLRVPMREVTLTPTQTNQGEEENPPVMIYDTSGPYTDPNARIDLMAGLAGRAHRLDRGARRYRTPRRPHLRLRPRPPGRSQPSPICASSTCAPRAAPSPAATSPRCTMPARGSSPRRWSTSPSARTCASTSCAPIRATPRCCVSIPASPSAPPCPRPSRPSSSATRSRAGAPSSRPTSTTPNSSP